ncbi:hypothetical protein Bca101_003221 [Brassica carinata]
MPFFALAPSALDTSFGGLCLQVVENRLSSISFFCSKTLKILIGASQPVKASDESVAVVIGSLSLPLLLSLLCLTSFSLSLICRYTFYCGLLLSSGVAARWFRVLERW